VLITLSITCPCSLGLHVDSVIWFEGTAPVLSFHFHLPFIATILVPFCYYDPWHQLSILQLTKVWIDGLDHWTVGSRGCVRVSSTLAGGTGDILTIKVPNSSLSPRHSQLWEPRDEDPRFSTSTASRRNIYLSLTFCVVFQTRWLFYLFSFLYLVVKTVSTRERAWSVFAS
jgi:hypothetical protein